MNIVDVQITDVIAVPIDRTITIDGKKTLWSVGNNLDFARAKELGFTVPKFYGIRPKDYPETFAGTSNSFGDPDYKHGTNILMKHRDGFFWEAIGVDYYTFEPIYRGFYSTVRQAITHIVKFSSKS